VTSSSLRQKFIGIALVLTSIFLGLTAPSSAAQRPLAVELTNVTLTKDGSALLTTKINSAVGSQLSITPVISPAVANRTELDRFETNPPARTLDLAPTQFTTLSEESLTLSLRIAPGTLSDFADGLYGFGVRVQTGAQSQLVFKLAPWFSQGAQFENLNLAVVVPLTTNVDVLSGKVAAETELIRLANLLDISPKRTKQIQWLVDPALVDFLAAQSDPLAVSLLDTLDNLPNRNFLPYGQANVAGLLQAQQEQRIDNLLTNVAALPATNIALSNSGEFSSRDFARVADLELVALVANTELTNNSLVTTSAFSKVAGTRVFVSDEKASSCFRNTSMAYCLTNELAMITAEAPSKKRYALISTPTNWSVDAGEFDQLLAALNKQKWLTFTSLERIAQIEPEEFTNHKLATTVTLFPKAHLKAIDKLNKTANAFSALISDQELLDAAAKFGKLGYSKTWTNSKIATSALNQRTGELSSISDALSVSVTDVITIGATSTQIPLTVNNESDHRVRLKVALSANSLARFAPAQSELVEIDAGARLTVLVPVTLLGPGDLQISANLLTSNDEIVGNSESFVLRPTAYTRFAGLLVGVSLFIMLGLMSRNLFRRFRKSGNSQ
jgi:hypothetical protein